MLSVLSLLLLHAAVDLHLQERAARGVQLLDGSLCGRLLAEKDVKCKRRATPDIEDARDVRIVI
jgi:hypothetical protein